MPIKVKYDLKKLQEVPKIIKENYVQEITSGSSSDELIRIIRETIKKGLSPVNGWGRFEKYSQSYREKIKEGYLGDKKVSPVNMTLTGKMLDSLRLFVRNGKALLQFDDKKALWHNDGTNKLPERKLLPTGSSDKFNKRITDLLVSALKKAAAKKRN
jgi:hypothetical protein